MPRYFGVDSEGPAGEAAAVTASDATVLRPTRALYVGTTGNVAVRMFRGQNTLTFTTVPAGALLPLQVDKVLSTGTTASNIVGIW